MCSLWRTDKKSTKKSVRKSIDNFFFIYLYKEVEHPH